jgi:hypothetical protein
MFTFTLTADSAEKLNLAIVQAAARIYQGKDPEKTLDDFPLQDIVEHLKTKGFEVS